MVQVAVKNRSLHLLCTKLSAPTVVRDEPANERRSQALEVEFTGELQTEIGRTVSFRVKLSDYGVIKGWTAFFWGNANPHERNYCSRCKDDYTELYAKVGEALAQAGYPVAKWTYPLVYLDQCDLLKRTRAARGCYRMTLDCVCPVHGRFRDVQIDPGV